jgi:hypothetical protein
MPLGIWVVPQHGSLENLTDLFVPLFGSIHGQCVGTAVSALPLSHLHLSVKSGPRR